MGFLVLGERIEAKDGQNVHVLIINHESDIAEAASSLECVSGDLPPQNQVDEDLSDLLEGLQVDVLGPQARNDDRVQALLVEDVLQVLLVLGQQGKALARQLLENLILLLHEEEELSETSMLDELSLDVDAVEEHRGQSYDDHFLIHLVNLGQRLKDSRHNFILDDLFLAVFLNAQV